MSETKIQVPEGMIKAAESAHFDLYEAHPATPSVKYIHAHLEAALLWQRGNPPVPTEKQIDKVISRVHYVTAVDPGHNHGITRAIVMEWPRIMYDAPEPEVPEEVEDLLNCEPYRMTQERIIEAYRRGQQSK